MVECLRLSFFFSHVHRETLAPVTPTSCMEAHLSPGGNFDKQHIISHQSAHRSCPTACCCCFGKKGGNSPQPGIAAPNAAAAHLFPLNFDAVQLYCCEYTTLHREFSHFYLQVINSLLAGNGASLFKAATGCTTTRTTGIVALFSYSMLCLSMKIKFCHGKKYSGLGHENLETVSTEQLSQCCLVQIKMLCFFQQVFIQQFH